MSWLYSLIITSVLLSSGGTDLAEPSAAFYETLPALEIEQKDEIEKIEQSYPLNPDGRVRVSNVNGSIVIEAWDRSEVRLEATKIASSKELLSRLEVDVDARPEAFSITTRYGDTRNRGVVMSRSERLEVQYKLSVPRTARLDEIETVNGSVDVSDFVNYTKVSAVNGSVKATNLRGGANLSTVNGEVNADFESLTTGARISLGTVNGRVALTIPSDSNATIKADSLTGAILNDLGLLVRKGEYVGRNLHGQLGSGGVAIDLNSVSGSLSITRRKDGRSASGVTDLLSQTTTGARGVGGDRAAMVRTEAATREALEAARGVRVTTEQEAALIKKELEKIGPELARAAVDVDASIRATLKSPEVYRAMEQAMTVNTEALARLREVYWGTGVPYAERRSSTFKVNGVPQVNIEAKGCSLRIRSWDRPEVKYTLTEVSDRRGRQPLEVTEQGSDSTVDLRFIDSNRTPRFGFVGERADARIEVFVPKNSNLKIDIDGELRVEGVTGIVDLVGEGGMVDLREIDGTLNIAVTDSRVRLIGFKGVLQSDTADSTLLLEGDFSALRAKSTDDVIVLTVPVGANFRVAANEEIKTEGVEAVRESDALWRFGTGGAKYDFELTDVSLTVRNSNHLMARN